MVKLIKLTPSIAISSVTDVEPGPRSFARLANFQSNLEAKGA
jgi:hypothetical protein